MTIHELKLTDKQEICLIAKITVTLLPHHMSVLPLTSTDYPNKIHKDTFL